MTLGIAKKLSAFFFIFILIFYGTVADMFIKVRDMSRISDRIVGVNTEIGSLSRNLRDSLLDMDASLKKFRLLKKETYFNNFEAARLIYNRDLARVIRLSGKGSDVPWLKIRNGYQDMAGFLPEKNLAGPDSPWDDPARVSQWMDALAGAGRANQEAAEKALIRINDQSRRVIRNAVVGFGISILVGALGVVFISRSVLAPLGRLKAGMKQVSSENYTHVIPVTSRDEFGELAAAFNEMNRQLKADDGLRSDFIAALSHEIRTPLSSIRESVNMISEEVLGPLNDRQRKFLKIAGDETLRITCLLNHLLDTSVLAAGVETRGTEALKPVALDPDRLVRNAVQGVEASAAARKIEIRYHPEKGLPRVLGEKKEIGQVLINLIGNALKFSPENSRVNIGLRPEKNRLKFSISDMGPGIPEEKQALIFKKYYRDEAVRKHMDGVGLGLSIVKRIVRAHGGTVSVTNNKNGGCTFFFTLPVEKPGGGR